MGIWRHLALDIGQGKTALGTWKDTHFALMGGLRLNGVGGVVVLNGPKIFACMILLRALGGLMSITFERHKSIKYQREQHQIRRS